MEEMERRKLVVELEAILGRIHEGVIELDRFFDLNVDCCRAALNRKACESFDAEVVRSAMKTVAGFVRDMNNVEQDIPLSVLPASLCPICNGNLVTDEDLLTYLKRELKDAEAEHEQSTHEVDVSYLSGVIATLNKTIEKITGGVPIEG